MKKALLFGATGFVGSHLLEGLLQDSDYDQVTIMVRKTIPLQHPKLKTLIGDYHNLLALKPELKADEVFIALGTTKKKTPDQTEYYQVDHDYPILAAKIAKENGARSVFLVSSVGADANSNVFYIKTKGETERDIAALDFQHTHIFQPSMIMGHRKENRPFEKAMIQVWSVITPLLAGPLSSYKGMAGEDIARAMLAAAKNQTEKLKIYQWKEMLDLL